MEASSDPAIAVAQIFLERVVFSHRNDYMTLPPNTPPVVGNITVGITVGERQDGEAGLVRIEVKTDPESNPIYNVELGMVALVHRPAGKGGLAIGDFITSPASVNLLYPFVREAFANVTLRGRFGPVWLNLISPQALAAGLKAKAANGAALVSLERGFPRSDDQATTPVSKEDAKEGSSSQQASREGNTRKRPGRRKRPSAKT